MTVSSHNGYTYHDLSTSADMDEVVAHFHLAGGTEHGKRSGVAFARKMQTDSPKKNRARSRILQFYDSIKWPTSLRILTMPGMTWCFERQLLYARGIGNHGAYDYPRAKTSITCVENDPMIYRASLKQIPGRWNLRCRGPRAVDTRSIHGFYFINVEDYITDVNCRFFDAAWLDFTGPLTQARLEAIEHFWTHKCGLHLTITSLAARWPRDFGKLVERHTGLTWLLLAKCENSTLVDGYVYSDGVPMHQITLGKATPSLRYLGYHSKPKKTISWLLKGGLQ